ncbi:hypothetical protein ABZ424_18120 [Streptomyces sp. NPDC005790]|uniref:hypothetical protein n=1 Tax=Streptomyces sp. NPDC005790 TaxID=3154777 RepID=UPI0033F1E5F6
MSFLDPSAETEDQPDIDPATFDAEDTELVSLAEQLRTQLEEIDGKRADISKRRAEAGPSRTQIRETIMAELKLFDDDDDPMPVGIKRIVDANVKEWQAAYRERVGTDRAPMIDLYGQGIGDSGVSYEKIAGKGAMEKLAAQIDDWYTDRANSRNRRGPGARDIDPAMVDRMYKNHKAAAKDLVRHPPLGDN